jgi:hypothetical protein
MGGPSFQPALPVASPVPPRMSARRHPLLDTSRPLGRAVRLCAVAGALGGAIALGIPLCPVAILTRHPCPGCGLTRATLALLHGHVHEAAHLHPLVFVVTPVIAVAFTYNALCYVRRGEWFASERFRGRLVTGAWITLGAAMMLLWIARFFGAFGGPVPV